MDIVVDTNILFSFFRENPVRYIIINAKSLGLKLFAPEYAIQELKNKINDLIKYTKVNSIKELEIIFENLEQNIETKPIDFFKEYKPEALKITPDEKDAPFFALALKLKCSIWSNEPRLKNQSIIKIYSTPDMKKLLNYT